MPLKLTNTNAAYNGHTVPFADLRSGRAYGGRTASFRAYGVPYESKLRGVCFPLHLGRPYRSKGKTS